MFYENSITSEFSFEGGLPASSAESEARHLINRLRFEFRTASQRQLEDAVAEAVKNATTYSSEKTLRLARAGLEQLLTSALERSLAEPEPSEPPFRAEVQAGVTTTGLTSSPAS